MSVEENKVIISRLIGEVWDQRDTSIIDEIVAKDYLYHIPTEDVRGPERYKQWVKRYHIAFPDIRFTIEDMVAEEDKVVTRWTARGTHKGDLMGIPPTGKPMTVTGTHMYRLISGKLVEQWGNWDQLGMLQQLGVIPSPG